VTAPAFRPVQVPRVESGSRKGCPKVLLPDLSKIAVYSRVTSYVDCLDDQEPLTGWKKRKVAEGLAIRPDLLLAVNSLGPEPSRLEAAAYKDWRGRMNELCEQAIEAAKAGARATIGSALHALCERLDRGETLGAVPEQYIPHLTAYQEATAHLHPVHIEEFSVLDELQVGGTPDRVVRIDGEDGLFIADIKTGSLDFGVGKMAMQLAIYAHSVLYDPSSGKRTGYAGPVNAERGLIIGLNADTGIVELLWIDIAAGWQAVGLATQVRAWRNRKGLTSHARPVIAVAPLEPTREAALLVAIDVASSVEDLEALWRAAGAAWTDEHTARAAARKAGLRRAA
jgi:hypothetical protein